MVAALDNGKSVDSPMNVGSLWNLGKTIGLHTAKRVPL